MPTEDTVSDTSPLNVNSTDKLSKDQSYRETIPGICSFMNWNHVPDFEESMIGENNPFAGP